jgi:rare lipoprotein A
VGEHSDDPDWHEAVASTYAQYGTALACGGRLGPQTVGVAHRSIACGTEITFRHDGHTATVPVIDRGPFIDGRDFDLTPAAAAELDLGDDIAAVEWHGP